MLNRVLVVTLYMVGFLSLEMPVTASDYYKVEVKRVASDLYQVLHEDLYIKTRFCYKYSYGEEAILEIDSPYGYTVGKIIFVDSGDKCDIEKLIK